MGYEEEGRVCIVTVTGMVVAERVRMEVTKTQLLNPTMHHQMIPFNCLSVSSYYLFCLFPHLFQPPQRPKDV